MDSDKNWEESKAKERVGVNFVKTVLGLSGYEVMDFGVENHNQEIIKQIKTNYAPETNRRLLSMPDFVVVDNDTKESWIVEAKYRSFKQAFDMKRSTITFRYGVMKSYLDFWKDATIIFVFNVAPYCLCVDVGKVNWNFHLKGKFENGRGKLDEAWNFSGIYQLINKKFPKVASESFSRAREIVKLG